MCDTCGCNVTHGNEHLLKSGAPLAQTSNGSESIEVLKGLLAANDHEAQHNREHFAEHRVLAVNLMSSPGAGKTALLEATIRDLGDRYRIAVIVGDLETENDAERIRRHGVPAIQISTGSACHLDAHMVHSALHGLDLQEIDIVFIENVGNLVCPASFDLGQHCNVTLLSSPEGDDKPQKYPVMFRAADLVLLSKSDLTPILGDFDPRRAERHVRELANGAPLIEVSSRNGHGMSAWTGWLERALQLQRANGAVEPQRHVHAAAHTHD
ncbi:MAG: hydrogenase nickel incorporation protein HypB [Gammaproteobacteria bacterium]|nr:hydrogenase nickel incorporation protein HypB [Gammaproteobacteria bacterium]MDH4314144.1 hydrogenase nickel incorporation protein HypB [Gammaproteobacteria bacterium]MDH5212784.1 hydrogenase nickel incorporation protein HypB [Gammaproteobacteria bacterium]MDH5500732.1 hydrogenase nickel incorporation protein HypB [Gammaproteobacteria bacterium]